MPKQVTIIHSLKKEKIKKNGMNSTIAEFQNTVKNTLLMMLLAESTKTESFKFIDKVIKNTPSEPS